MKKIIIETTIKQLDGEVEQIINQNQFVQEVEDTLATIKAVIEPEGQYIFNNREMGIKNMIVFSDKPIKISYTSGDNTFVYGEYVNGMMVQGGGASVANLIDQNGNITLENESTTDKANITIIYSY